MIKCLGDCSQMLSIWLRVLGSAYVVDDGMGDAVDLAKIRAGERKLAQRRGY